MATETAPDTAKLQTEIERLQAGLDEAVDKIRTLRGELPNGHDTTFASAEKMWSEVRRQAQQIGHEIEERPLVSAATAFGAGIALGLLFGGRRG
jgi:ElaB/YqjD/DUF883 family membrane-anchored ribosome-binding protein